MTTRQRVTDCRQLAGRYRLPLLNFCCSVGSTSRITIQDTVYNSRTCTGPQVAQPRVTPCVSRPPTWLWSKSRGRSPKTLPPPTLEPGNGAILTFVSMEMFLYLPSAKIRRPAGPFPRRRPPTPHQQGTPNPKWGEAEHNRLTFADILIHCSQASSNVMWNWCRPIASPYHLAGVRCRILRALGGHIEYKNSRQAVSGENPSKLVNCDKWNYYY